MRPLPGRTTISRGRMRTAGLFGQPVKKGVGMDRVVIAVFALAMLAAQPAGIFVIVYFAARLAIRHERVSKLKLDYAA